MALAPAVLSVLGFPFAFTKQASVLFLSALAAHWWIAVFRLIVCAVRIPPPRQGMTEARSIAWRTGWYFLFLVLHLSIMLVVTIAGCGAAGRSG
jgi:hypothetical protein